MIIAAHLVFLGACDNPPACDERKRTLDSPATAGTLGFSLDTALAGRRDVLSTVNWPAPPAWVGLSGVAGQPTLTWMLVDRSAPVEEVSAKRNAVVTNSPTSCASHVRSVLTLVLKTSDGSLDEELAVEVQAFSSDVVEVKGKLPVGALNGTLSVAEGVQLGVYVSFEAGGYRGNIVASEYLPTPSKNSTSGYMFSIATWNE